MQEAHLRNWCRHYVKRPVEVRVVRLVKDEKRRQRIHGPSLQTGPGFDLILLCGGHPNGRVSDLLESFGRAVCGRTRFVYVADFFGAAELNRRFVTEMAHPYYHVDRRRQFARRRRA
jgi:hypothetical protein